MSSRSPSLSSSQRSSKDKRRSKKDTQSDASSDTEGKESLNGSGGSDKGVDKGEKPLPKQTSAGSGEEQGEMISKDRQEQAARILATVESVLAHIAKNSLTGGAALLFILENSVDVQRTATLQQLHQHLDLHDEAPTRAALEGVLGSIALHSSQVQLAAVSGITTLLKDLSPRLLECLYGLVIPLVRTEGGTPPAKTETPDTSPNLAVRSISPVTNGLVPAEALKAWMQLFHDIVRRLPASVMIQVLEEQVVWRVAPTAAETQKLFGIETLVVILQELPEAGALATEVFVSLAEDASVPVRLATAEGLRTLLRCIPAIAIRERLMMTILTLLADVDIDVSCATFLTVLDMTEVAGDEFTHVVLKPVLRQYITNAPARVLSFTMKHFGKLVWNLRAAFDPLTVDAAQSAIEMKTPQQSSVRKAPPSTASFNTTSHGSLRSPTHGSGKPTSFGSARSPPRSPRKAGSTPPSTGILANAGTPMLAVSSVDSFVIPASAPDWVFMVQEFATQCGSQDVEIRQSCAFNLPAVMAAAPESLRVDIFNCVATLSKDTTSRVRTTVAAGFHELCKYATDSINQILPLVTRLISDPDTVVKDKLFRNLTDIFATAKAALGTAAKCDQFFGSLTPLIIAYEKEIHTNWRKVAVLLEHMQHFPGWFSSADLFTKYVPLLVSHLVSGASALNKQVCRTIALFLRRFGSPDDCVKVHVAVRNMTNVLARNKSAAGRMGFVTLVAEMLHTFSQEFVKTILFPALVPLALDKVLNVRIHLARYVPLLRRFPAIAGAGVDDSIMKVLNADQEHDVRNVLQAAEAAMAASGAKPFSAHRNATLIAEEGPHLLAKDVISKAIALLEQANAKAQAQAAAVAAARKKGSDAVRRS
jgi:hypothetical protein